jgi:hypothetical protein
MPYLPAMRGAVQARALDRAGMIGYSLISALP